jgi:hypothetical protein
VTGKSGRKGRKGKMMNGKIRTRIRKTMERAMRETED